MREGLTVTSAFASCDLRCTRPFGLRTVTKHRAIEHRRRTAGGAGSHKKQEGKKGLVNARFFLVRVFLFSCESLKCMLLLVAEKKLLHLAIVLPSCEASSIDDVFCTLVQKTSVIPRNSYLTSCCE